jgi:1-acyl-sn-glycerol-3-phosphate acyltransferase
MAVTSGTLLRFVRWVLPRIARVEIVGSEHVPAEGPAIFVFNHLGIFDGPLAYQSIGREDTSGWVAEKNQANPFYAYLVRVIDGVWLDRANPQASSFKQALAWLRKGGAFGVAPEGNRSPTNALLPGKPGVAYLAAMSGATIVPGGHTGTERVWQSWLRLRKPVLRMRFGPAFTLPPLPREGREAALQACIDEIMCRIAALLPEDYRGAYADFPRVQELLATPPLANRFQDTNFESLPLSHIAEEGS